MWNESKKKVKTKTIDKRKVNKYTNKQKIKTKKDVSNLNVHLPP